MGEPDTIAALETLKRRVGVPTLNGESDSIATDMIDWLSSDA